MSEANAETTCIQVEVELKRIQTFLFQVPRLKAMLGANALVGETMRVKLYELACGLAWKPKEAGIGDLAPAPAKDDPLKKHPDNPGEAYSQGVLARDGGHFTALFETDEKADEFIRQAERLISEQLPGVLFELRKKTFDTTEADNAAKSKTDQKTTPPSVALVEAMPDLPVLQICTATGQGPATYRDRRAEEKRYLSHSARLREERGDEFYKGETEDIIGLLQKELGIKEGRPEDLNDLADGGYLALIHADGNNIGKRYTAWRDTLDKGDKDHAGAQAPLQKALRKEAHGEKFFHGMRVAVRKAVVEAIGATFPASVRGHLGQRLYQPLMLGGDDLVMVCRADLALPFCVELCRCVAGHNLPDGAPVTLGIGVAIAKPGYPFYRLHELAEELAGSAKRLARGQQGGNGASVIDWQVVSQSSFEGLAETRRRADFIHYRTGPEREETLILSRRPYRVLKDETAPTPLGSLEQLLDAANTLDTLQDAARSALRGLRPEYRKGRLHGELAFDNLIPPNREALRKAGVDAAWLRLGDYCTTPLFDLIDITEIKHLGHRKSK